MPPEGRRSEWLYSELRNAILHRRLRRGTQIPATRDIARHFGVARGTVVAVFEQLRAEGYVESRRGSGTFISERLPEDLLPSRAIPPARRTQIGRTQTVIPAPRASGPPRAFRLNEPALDAFPIDVWARIGSRRLHGASRLLLASGDARGYRPLREAVAGYLAASRGVRCEADQVVIVSGTQQALDLLARLVFKPGDAVWMEDPGYSGALAVLRRAAVQIVPVRVDDRGIDVTLAERLAPDARAAYVTPAHQFPLGVAMPAERRLALLDWARRAGALVIEDDYDSEFRFEGRPLPALQGIANEQQVIFIGSFNKALFPSLRIGYVVLPHSLVEPFAALRFHTDRYSPQIEQAILCEFISEGHFARHLRRMRMLYQSRLHALREAISRELAGVLEIPRIEAGLQTAALLKSGVESSRAVAAAIAHNLEVEDLNRFAIKRRDISGLHLGFAAIDEEEIRRGAHELARALAFKNPA